MLLTNYGINHHILKRDVNHVIIEVVGSLKKKKLSGHIYDCPLCKAVHTLNFWPRKAGKRHKHFDICKALLADSMRHRPINLGRASKTHTMYFKTAESEGKTTRTAQD